MDPYVVVLELPTSQLISPSWRIYIYIYASVNRIRIGSDNGLSPIQCPSIILTNAKLLSIGPQEQF